MTDAVSAPGNFARLRGALTLLFPDPDVVHHVLNIGCGGFPSARVLRQMFPAALLLGIDLHVAALRRAAGLHLIAADAARLPLAGHVRFDLILLRHPDVDRHPAHWREVCGGLPGRLQDGGRILVSCYAGHEAVFCRRGILAAGGVQPIPIPAGPAPPGLAGQDRLLLAFGRRAG